MVLKGRKFRAALKNPNLCNSTQTHTHIEKHTHVLIHEETKIIGSTRAGMFKDHKVELKG